MASYIINHEAVRKRFMRLVNREGLADKRITCLSQSRCKALFREINRLVEGEIEEQANESWRITPPNNKRAM